MATILFVVAALLQLSAAKVVFKYEGQAIIGIPESGREGNVIRMEFNVGITRIAGTSDLVIQVDPETIKVHNYTGYLFPIPEGIIAPDRMTLALQGAGTAQGLAAQLSKPVVVSRDENGTLSNIRHDTSEPYWSVNLKRGMLSLFQLNVQTDNGVYTVQEDDITGSCPTTYLVQSREHYHGHDHAAPNFLNITKSRDYTKCTNRTILRHSFFSGISMSDEKLAEKNIISNARFAYNISGTKALGGLLMIDSATSEAQHIFTVFKPLSGSLAVYTHQRATLLSANSDTATLPDGSYMSSGWPMVMPNVNTAPESAKFADEEVTGPVREAVNKLVNPDTPSYMRGILLNRILERVRGAKASAWQAIGEAALQATPAHLKLLLDLAPSVGTLEVLQKTQENLPRLTPNITAQFFAISGLFGQPTFQMLGTMRSICQSQYVRETTRELKSCMLSYASMIHNRYIRSGYYLKNATFSDEEKAAIADFQNTVSQYYDQVQGNVTAMLLWVKVAGNLGWNQLMPHLLKIANNDSHPIVVRVHAIRAFRRMPEENYASIQNSLLPIFTDWHNDAEIRIAAYRAIMATNPSQGTLDMISGALHQEHSEHVRTYVYSHLTILTKNPLVQDIPLSDRARVTLQGLSSMIPFGMQYSRVHRLIDTYDDDRNAGFTLDVSHVGSSRSLWPREICIWGQGTIMGLRGNAFHFCLRLQGIQRALQKLFRAAGPVYPEFYAQLGLNQIDYEEYHGMLDFSVEGNEMQFMEIPPYISQAMSDPAVLVRYAGAAIEMLRTPIFKTMVLDSTLQIPSLIGIPVQQNNTYAWHLNMSLGNVSFLSACRFNPSQMCQFSAKPQGTYNLGSQHSIGIDAGVMQSKVLLHGMVSRSRGDDRNWTISWSRNLQNTSIIFDAKLPRERISTAHTEVIPLLITVDRTKATIDEQLNIREMNSWVSGVIPDYNYHVQLNTTAKITGFMFGFNKTATRCHSFPLIPAGKGNYPFCGKVVRDFYVIPQPDAPDRVQISYRRVGAPLSDVQSSENSFRSSDASTLEDEHEQHIAIHELSKLSNTLREEMREVEEIEEHIANMRDEADSIAVDEEIVEEQEEELVRSRRSVYKPGRKDKKPGVGKDRLQRPAGDEPEPVNKQKVAEDTGSMSLEIIGFRDGQVSRKIELNINRAKTNEPKQFQRDFTLKTTIGGRQVATFCGKATVQYPQGVVGLDNEATGAEPVWSYVSKVEYGTESCESDKTMEMHINFSRSAEQKLATQLFRSRSPAGNRFYVVRMCMDEIAKGQPYTWPCRHLFNELNAAHRLDFVIKAKDHKKLSFGSVDMRDWLSAFFLHMRVRHWKNLKTSFVRDLKHDSKEISVSSERNFQLPYLSDITLKTPETTSQFENVHMMNHPPSLYFTTTYTMIYYCSGFRLPGTCVAHRNQGGRMYVSTFDNLAYNATAPACTNGNLNVLLAADCSAASKFSVYISYDGASKQPSLNIQTAAHQTLVKMQGKDGPEVHLDGKKVVEQIYRVYGGDNELVIENNYKWVSIRHSIGLYVSLSPDGAIMISLSPLYSGLTCGLCGDYNGQQIDEFTLPDGTLTADASVFQSSFVSQQCSA
jgi:uncharacterized membrane protein